MQKLVMDWIGKRIGFYPNVNTRSMSRDFSDGLLFCALLHKQNSKSIKWQVLDKVSRTTRELRDTWRRVTIGTHTHKHPKTYTQHR